MAQNRDKLTALRRKIEAIDKEILSAVARRADVVRAIGRLKKMLGKKPLDRARKEAQKARWLALSKAKKLPAKLANSIYAELHRHALSVEKNPRI